MKLRLIVLFQLLLLNANSQNGILDSIPNRISEERFIKINGIEQWVTIKGDSTKPLVLFIHGGPGNPLSPFSDAIYGKWEKDFVLVQWDQRGAGRTYGHNAPEELTPEYMQSNPLTMEQMTTDGIELAQYLIQHLGKQKIILFGTSWGSVLGTKMAIKKPEFFYAYVGHSQIVNPYAAELTAHKKVYEMAKNDKDQESIDILNSIGKPPYDTAKNTGRLNRIIQKYQQKKSIPPPPSWFKLSPEYDNKKDNQNRSNGDDYSFVNYAGDKRLEIASLSSTINFLKDGLAFNIPVYFIQGEEDIQTPAVITSEYYNKLKAPEKKFIVIPKADHGFNQSVVDAQYKIMIEFILPLANRN
jgi:pimeloyl-ACP methyl ester carboxylesterase